MFCKSINEVWYIRKLVISKYRVDGILLDIMINGFMWWKHVATI